MVKCVLVLFFSMSVTAQAACKIFLIPGAFSSHGKTAHFFLKPENYLAHAAQYFKTKSCDVKMASLPNDATIEERALVIRDQIQAWAQADKVIVLAHSQGGLDIRYALKTADPTLKKVVKAVVTLGTPHKGTPLAREVVWQVENQGWIAWFFKNILGYDFSVLRFAPEMTPEFLASKTSYFEALPEVKYASGTGRCKTECFFAFSMVKLWVDIGPGDGIIPDWSQSFGVNLGEYDLDHMSEIDMNPKKASERERFFVNTWKWLEKI